MGIGAPQDFGFFRVIRETCPELVEGFVVTGRADRDVSPYIHSVRVIREIRGYISPRADTEFSPYIAGAGKPRLSDP